MNIYQKIQTVRVELDKMNLKKTGENKYSNFKYYELPNFLPAVNALCYKHGLYTEFRMEDRQLAEGDKLTEFAILTIINSEKPEEKRVFPLKTAEVEIGKKKDGSGGAEPIQNMGGKITYMRRYALTIAFEISESDIVDAVNKQITEILKESDLELIKKSKTEKELLEVCGSLKKKYKYNLITPHFDKRRAELTQDEVEDQSKGTK
jgi:hypothetical protein